MEFLNPTALYAFFLVPLLFLPYLFRARPKRTVFSSLVILRELVARPQGRGWRWLRLPPIFFLQLLLLSLLFFIMGEPVLSVDPVNIALVIDNSASMQSLEGDRSRFEIAQQEARKLLSGLAARARVDVFTTVPRLEQIGEKSLDAGKAQALIGNLRPYDLGDSSGDPGGAVGSLMKSRGYDRVFFLTDHPVARQGESIKVISVGAPKENLALTAFQVSPASFPSQRLRASAEVRSFSANERKARVSINSAGKMLSTRTVAVPAGASIEVSFDDLPAHPYYEAVILESDGLSLDNRRFAVSPIDQAWEVLAVSPRPEVLQSLRSIPGISLSVITPQEYGKRRQNRHALEIFHYSMPQSLPSRHALFILPPTENPLARLGPPLQRPVISGWREPHPLTEYVNFSLFRPSYARPLTARAVTESILESPGGSLALTMERGGFRYLVLGFDPLPYLGRENLPMSVFTVNLFKWFYKGLGATETLSGQPIAFSVLKEAGWVLTPKGERVELKANTSEFAGTFFQGLYQVMREQRKEWVAVNFHGPSESDLLHPLPIGVQDEAKTAGERRGFLRLWSWLLMAALVLLLLERFLNPPAVQPQAAIPR